MRRALIHHNFLRCSRLGRDAATAPLKRRRRFNATQTVVSRGTADLQQLEAILSHPTLGVLNASAFYDKDVKPRIKAYLEESQRNEAGDATPDEPQNVTQPFMDAKGEAFLILMMKALCDAKRLEDVRLVFAIALREIVTPSTELFNVLLIGITWSDTFTADEIDNVWALMSERHVVRDAMTDLCFLHAYVRLQRFAFLENHWAEVRDKCAAVVHATLADPSRPPLPVGLSMKLSQTVATLMRMSPQLKPMWELLDIILPFHRVAARVMLEEHLSAMTSESPEKVLRSSGDETLLASRVILTTKTLVVSLTACLSNAAVRSSDLQKLFQALLQQYELEHRLEMDRRDQTASELLPSTSSPSTELGSSTGIATKDTSDTMIRPATASPLPPIFASQCAVSAVNAFRLVARCLRDRDLTFAKELFVYATAPTHRIFATPEMQSQFRIAMAQVAAAAAATGSGDRIDAPGGPLDELFDHLEGALSQHTTSSELALPTVVPVLPEGSTDAKPIQLVVSTRAPAAVIRALLTRSGVASPLQALQCIEQRRDREGCTVTLASVHRVLDAFAALGEAEHCRALIVSMHETWGLQPTAETYEFMVFGAIVRATRLPGSIHVPSWVDATLDTMQHSDPPLKPTAALFRAVLKHYVHAGDTAQALVMVQAHRTRGIPLERNIAAALMRELCHIIDKEGIGATLDAWQELNGRVDARVLRMVDMALHKWGIDAGSLVAAYRSAA